MTPEINGDRLLARLEALAAIGRNRSGELTRLALSDEDTRARAQVILWLEEAGSRVWVDRIGNIHAVCSGENTQPAVCTGSHIDTVINAGTLDGSFGVLAGIELLQTLHEQGLKPTTSIEVIVFTNEEGVRFTPDLLGSRVMVKDVSLSEALAVESRTGEQFGNELKRSGSGGDADPWRHLPGSFVELHIEQGPLLEATNNQIGIVEGVQGHSWWQVEVQGQANHAGTTPMHLRRDAGQAAMRLAQSLSEHAALQGVPAVATVGTLSLVPGAINVVPGLARFTVDFRDASADVLRQADIRLHQEARQLEDDGFRVDLRSISRAEPVFFSADIVTAISDAASARTPRTMRMISGASHDAQMISRICPTAMIFVPSVGGISHHPAEATAVADLIMGAQILADVVWTLAN
ncbi:M20 family metallo-hydrolase [Erwinia sp. JUb26]|uniref:M20 family metallo-hydrolase n=1 Tax=Erwinia sp. JUb26 TaxID=2485126 RepID=UPI000F487966|nr:M20 family metallo-hydrolase [Erwinia sp. JUb26]ROR08705.1 N-carbamoyl-L-amino-acid hydrolase [Erwinia sp. JUb26]